MYAAYIMRERTQIYLEPEQSDRLGKLAGMNGRSKSDLIREAIDMYLSSANRDDEDLRELKKAAKWFREHPLELPSGVEYVARLRRGERKRQDALDKRWLQ